MSQAQLQDIMAAFYAKVLPDPVLANFFGDAEGGALQVGRSCWAVTRVLPMSGCRWALPG